MKRFVLLALGLSFVAQTALAIQCLPEFDDDYHQSITSPMCQNITNFFIGGLTDELQQPVRDKLIVSNITPANATAYVSITPNSPLILDFQISTFVIPLQEGQCLDLISTYQKDFPPKSFQLKLVAGDNSAATADFDFEVGSSCE